MNKHNFKIGDRVFDIHHGWMIVNKICNDEIETDLILTTTQKHGKFDFTYTYFEEDLRFLSFVEYPLEGVVQERPKEEFIIGNMGYFWDYSHFPSCIYSRLIRITNDVNSPYETSNYIFYKYFSLTPPDLNY